MVNDTSAKINERELHLAKQYAPIIYFDEHEPFYPVRIGVSVLDNPSSSPSFTRQFHCSHEELQFIIEYAIYWDYDIEHLYDLEHIWVYVAKDGRVLDCEASFHGEYLKGMFKSRDNMEGTHVVLYSQPGKHAFLPDARMFELIPDYDTCTDDTAGSAGLIVTRAFKGLYETSDAINKSVEAYLQRYRFKPAGKYVPYELTEDLFVSWEELRREVPERIRTELARIERELSS